MAAPKEISALVERFDRNREAYRSVQYNETQLRREFLDPFLEALGWDVTNKQGHAEAYKDVIHEDAIKVGGYTKAPDYCFRIGGTRKFFVEAKKPAVDIKDGIDPAYQLRRYAWSAKLPLSILTDFEEFAVYDCRSKPTPTDKASTARTIYVTYTEYPQRWDEIASIFSREAVLKGSFDKYVESSKAKKGTAEVDDAFLQEIESWRDLLARHLALRNADLTQRELNFSVQQTIDRLIFLRICEDRGIEEYGKLMAQLNGDGIYGRLCQLFQRADERYDSGLFHFRHEKGRTEPPDELTLKLLVDDKPLKEIIKNLYYPDSPYEFSVLPADILGQVYEQFLGKVIRLTARHRAVVEDKPEVKKAGGVYYTPTYIVDYIVKNTVGELLKGKTPKQVAKLRILDPACGSGSFLIGAYQTLLDWHRDWYVKNGPKKLATGRSPVIYQVSGGDWRLTTAERKRILINNIYGVDIDPQAVEVTKLSLLLKVLEGENEQTLTRQLVMLHYRALPDLGNNIKCGNSLIGSDFYDNQQMSFPDEEESYRVNAFDWKAGFPAIMKAAGFDVVIGNPPYIRALYLSSEKQYYKQRFASASGSYDIYVLFMERALELIRQGGIVGLITPNKFFVADYAAKIRNRLLHDASIIEIADLGKCKSIFSGALISTAITFYAKSKPLDRIRLKILSDDNVNQISGVQAEIVPRSQIVTPEGAMRVYQDAKASAILDKIAQKSKKLSTVAQVRTGVMGFDYWAMDKYIYDTNRGRRIATNSYIDRYIFLWGKKVRLYNREVSEPRLDKNCDVLSDNTLELFASKKIVVRGVARRLTAMLDEEGVGILVAVHSVIGESYDNKFLLGLLNSKLFNWLHIVQFYSARIPEGSLRYPISFLSNLPICSMDLSASVDKARYGRMMQLVERMLALHKQLAAAKTDQDKAILQRQIETTDQHIDGLVYELYGLTEKEIRIVEEETKP
jgi:type I restriction-modification system DNA methylase subunit